MSQKQTTKTELKMARASDEECQALVRFMGFLEEKAEFLEDIDFEEFYKEFANISSFWQRVVYGYMALADNAADKSLSYLDWKPEIKAALDVYETSGQGKPLYLYEIITGKVGNSYCRVYVIEEDEDQALTCASKKTGIPMDKLNISASMTVKKGACSEDSDDGLNMRADKEESMK